MKKFLLWVLVICMLMSMGIVNITAVADGVCGDEYSLYRADWPTKHWVFMSPEEVAAYEAAGWKQNVGVLWMNSNGWSWYHDQDDQKLQNVNANQVQALYNEGYTFHVFYTWVCPFEVQKTFGEQSVTVGQWILSPEQAAYYHKTYIVPEFVMSVTPSISYDSEWYFEGKSADWFENDSIDVMNKFDFVRHIYETYDFGYGSRLHLRNGEYEVFSYTEALQINDTVGFNFELPEWQ